MSTKRDPDERGKERPDDSPAWGAPILIAMLLITVACALFHVHRLGKDPSGPPPRCAGSDMEHAAHDR